jgi:competence protein ComEA
MFKKMILTLSVVSVSSLFAMSLSQLNSASKTDLMKINGIGEAKATAIIKARAKGKFKSFDDLQKVKGIGPSITSNLKNDVTSQAKSKAKSHTKKKVSKKLDTKKLKKSTTKKLKTKTKK